MHKTYRLLSNLQITYKSLDNKSPLRGHVAQYWTVNNYSKELPSYMVKKERKLRKHCATS